MKIVDRVMNYFGFVDSGAIEKIVSEKMAAVDKPRPTNVDMDDEMVSSQPADEYWSKKIKNIIYLDDTDKTRYKELNDMDNEVPEISAALDVNADYVIYPNDHDNSKAVKVISTNTKAQNKIEEIESRVSIQEQLFPQIRAMLKYGDNAEELVLDLAGKKFLGFRNIPIKTIAPIMIDGFPSKEPRLSQIIAGAVHAEFNDNEIFHLCLNTDRERFCKYGKGVSMVEKSRLLYRQLRLMEEGMMITRLSRANQNYAMIVDVGELQGDEALAFLDSYKKRIMRRKYINPQTGQWSWEYNPLSVIEDIMVPTRAGSGGNVIPLNNNANTGKDIEDIMYCEDKLIYSTGTPKLLIGKEVDVNSKSTSDNQMGNFLRRIRRIQTIITPAIKGLYQNILAVEGVPVSLDELDVVWPLSLTIDEERKMTIEKIKCEIAKMLMVDMDVIDDIFIYNRVLGMTQDEASEMQRRMKIAREERQEKADALLAKQKAAGVAAGDDEEDNEEEPAPKTKEELIKIVKGKLSESEFKEWEKMQKIINKNPKFGGLVLNLIDLLQAQTGN